MNKRIKRITTIALTISAFSVMEPSKYLNLMTTKAYADVKGAELDALSVDYGTLNFKASKTDYSLQYDVSKDKMTVTARPQSEFADTTEVRINGTTVTADDEYKREIDLDKGSNTITIDVENGSKKKTYTIEVMRGHIDETQIYLDDIKLSDGDINFSQDKTDYNVNVSADTSDISIKAIPENTDYDEEIDGVTVTDDNNYKKTVTLKDGNNDVSIRIRDTDDHEKIYTLHINKGAANTQTQASNNTTNTTTNQQGTNVTVPSATAKGWVLNNGQWNYIDEKGNKETGWKQINSVWYYLDTNGAMKTGWLNANGDWYYLDSSGAMKTGWFKDYDGKWYYLYDSGAMAKNATVGGYKLDSNGAWIK
ncbi:cadherin-like beta sandwich domain-containing protein [Clostridium sp.]|uniref:cadherin-like beta sandwich domain-containing protein n=1 Tax=Clostridium sp. TaxID=1506 RepID=UPI00284921BF|nr:cadherin-like beta sandwich domain-containing protein [Clostridium sp.]MDR3593449.1 cadherin-like beta sandwich domain-containing protein [Clostridium sp.]